MPIQLHRENIRKLFIIRGCAAPFVSKDGFRFKIYRKGILNWLGNIFGIKSISTGDPSFDDTFIIQGKPENQILQLLHNEAIRDLIQNQKSFYFEIKDDEGWGASWWNRNKIPKDVDILYSQETGIIKDKERLKDLFKLFSLTLDELCYLESAAEKDPGVTL